MNPYQIKHTDQIDTPALVYYRDMIITNTKKAIEEAGGPERLWPHVKTHKMNAMVHMQRDMGITRFKCATIAEGEMLANCGAEEILVAYPLVGPAIDRFLQLAEEHPQAKFYAIGDSLAQLSLLGKASLTLGRTTEVLVDVNMGMNRTGVPLEYLEQFCLDCAQIEGIHITGLHCYDGHHSIPDPEERMAAVEGKVSRILQIKDGLEGSGLELPILIMGGTPSFPCHARYSGTFLSPGTIFVNDYSYSSRFPDLEYQPGAVILTRVVSHPEKGLFTLDTGVKAIASDPEGARGVIVGLENKAEAISQSEEHWVFRMKKGFEDKLPPIGKVLYVIPSHICPTSALYAEALVAEKGKVTGRWQVTARNRKITV